jgi:hypothetical protein
MFDMVSYTSSQLEQVRERRQITTKQLMGFISEYPVWTSAELPAVLTELPVVFFEYII